MTEGEITECARLHDLIYNRVGICNQILGCRYHHNADNPLRIVKTGAVGVVTVDDVKVGEFKGLDRESLLKVYDMVDSWSELMWHLSRTGFIQKQTGDTLACRIA